MHLKQMALERQEDLLYSSSLSFQGDSASTSLSSAMSQVCNALLPSQNSESSSLETVVEKPCIWKYVTLGIKPMDAMCMQNTGLLYLKLVLPQTSRNRRLYVWPKEFKQSHISAQNQRFCSQKFEHKRV